MGLSDPWVAYCFDEAAHTWGSHVENEMQTAENSQKEVEQKMFMRRSVLESLLTQPDENESAVGPAPARYADPAALFGKK